MRQEFHILSGYPASTETIREKNGKMDSFEYACCRVKELEKARFRKRMRPTLYRNRSPLMRREGAAVRLVSCWRIPWTAEPGRLPSMGSHRVRCD